MQHPSTQAAVAEHDHHVYPGEMAGLLAFAFAPSLIVAFVLQGLFLAKRGLLRSRPQRTLVAFLFTTLISIVLGVALLLAAHSLEPPSSFGLTNVVVGGGYWPSFR